MAAGRREAVLLLCSRDAVLGSLPPLPTELPWWPEVWDVVAAAKLAYGLDVVVLRLLTTSVPRMPGGTITYLAEVDPTECRNLPLAPWSGADPLADHPLRQSWARPGGPSQHLDWAAERLTAAGIVLTAVPVQVKTWNLSTLWRLPTDHGQVWLKVVPEFFAHESAIMAALGPASVPRVYAAEPGRIILADVPCTNFETTGAALMPMVDVLIELQAAWLGREDELLAMGLPDRRLDAAERRRIETVVEDHVDELDASLQPELRTLVDDLDQRFAAIEVCGIPATLTHGDFHSGNVLGRPGEYVVMDWGDSCLSSPLTDELAFTRPLLESDRARATEAFGNGWRRRVPGCAPERAAALLRPVLPLVAAVNYAAFCDRIEPDERIYHAADVSDMLRLAVLESRA